MGQSHSRRKRTESFGKDAYPKLNQITTNAYHGSETEVGSRQQNQCHEGLKVNKMMHKIRTIVKDIEQEIDVWNKEYSALQEVSCNIEVKQAMQVIVAHRDRCESMKMALLQSSLQLKASRTKKVLTESLILIHDVLTNFSDESHLKNINALAWDVEKKQAENKFKEELQEWIFIRTGGVHLS